MSSKPQGNPPSPTSPSTTTPSTPATPPKANAPSPVEALGFLVIGAIIAVVAIACLLGYALRGGLEKPGVLQTFYNNNLIVALPFTAALIAIAVTPLAFAFLAHQKYFEARRGRVQLKPGFYSVVMGMILTMGVPCIFAALVVKSQFFDEDRYAFDPNRTKSVLDQGRGYNNLKEADDAVRREMKRLEEERNKLVNSVKALDGELLKMRAIATQSRPVAVAMNPILERLAEIRRAIRLDAPQQLIDLKALPAELPGAPPIAIAMGGATSAPAAVAAPAADPSKGKGLTKAEIDVEMVAVPDPQKPLAAMLPVDDVPKGWTIEKLGNRYLETFNDQNLYEKIDGRAESFLPYGVKGMAYSAFQPEDDHTNDIQVYVYEMGSPVNAFGKYGTEKPEQIQAVPVGDEGYSSAGSVSFYSGKYYTQIVSTDPKFTDTAIAIAKVVASRQKPAGGTVAATDTPAGANAEIPATPKGLFSLLPKDPQKSNEVYLAESAFGYVSLTHVFSANYKHDAKVDWDGFLRPYKTADAAKAALAKYETEVKTLDAKVTKLAPEAGVEIWVFHALDMYDVIFVKDHVLGGVNGSEKLEPAEVFVRKLIKSLPAKIPVITSDEAPVPTGGGEYKEQ